VPARLDGGHRGTRAVQHLVEHAPCTGALALWVPHRDLTVAPAAAASAGAGGTAAPLTSDGTTVFYAPHFESLPLAEQAGRVAQAVLHIALRHAQRRLDLQRQLGAVDAQLFGLCADAIVNSSLAHLAWLALPAGAVTLAGLLQATLGIEVDESRALAEWDLERLYRAVDDRQPPGRGAAQAQAGTPSSDGATPAGAEQRDGPRAAVARALGRRRAPCLQLGTDDLPGGPEQDAAMTCEWQARIARAHAGDGRFSMLRALTADMTDTHTPWEHVLRTQLARHLAPQTALSWSRPSRSYLANQGRAGPGRRMPWEPGCSTSRRVPRLAVVVDVSGSIDTGLLLRFGHEVEALSRRLQAAWVLIVGDDRVRHEQCFEPGKGRLGELSFEGGGDTDFTPLLEAAHRQRPDAAVVLTDLQGPARFRPPWPVLWAVPAAYRNAEPPFGRRLVLK
jgi:hypothetical protein